MQCRGKRRRGPNGDVSKLSLKNTSALRVKAWLLSHFGRMLDV